MDVNQIVDEAIAVSYTICYPIEEFTIADLIKLSEEAYIKKVELRMKAEHSNFFNGTLIEVQRLWDRVNSNI